MADDNKSSAIAVVLLFAICLQVLFVFAETRETPEKAAVRFTKKYFCLDAAVKNYLCAEILADEERDVVDAYIYGRALEAEKQGYKATFMRNRISHLEPKLVNQDENTAQVHLKVTYKKYLNPIYSVVGRLFNLGETYHVEETLNLVKENGHWKVCGQPYQLTEI
jgi:hypothetical protein